MITLLTILGIIFYVSGGPIGTYFMCKNQGYMDADDILISVISMTIGPLWLVLGIAHASSFKIKLK